MRKQKGFSLIELLIVVAIILIIAAIAVPNLLRSRMAANEASAVGSIRTINTAQVMYSTTYPGTGYTALAALGGASPCTASPTTACIVDPAISSGTNTKSGYTFASAPAAGTPSIAFTVNGNPVTFGSTGMRNFFSNESFVIRYSTNGSAAAVTDAALQ
jgi:prepilin-type N-terminal cleavage/methylation domain-containing protein